MTETQGKIPKWFQFLEGPELLREILRAYNEGTLVGELTAYREEIERWENKKTDVTTPIKMRPVFAPHTVRRIIQRRVSVDAVEQIAKFGVVVQDSGLRVMKRGEVQGIPIHVVVERPNVVVTVYFANEWKSTVTVNRVGKPRDKKVILAM
ncbi:hypothetical protein LLE49_25130 [Alicyclobacillus tolerans]|uniref:hypothetical protein n=1 Tax=Alicyclobacillus tolerans TaxID=90970 RepID=UPI001F45F043|nr:hypothetical protein [Alicyclobacillus tolerans]MCF8568012.1 hypothetical protein [Alicyclobacillus tolerans]